MTLARVSCGCETAEGRLVTVCGMHGNYTRQHVEKAKLPREGVDKELQRQLVVVITPIVVRAWDPEAGDDAGMAEAIHSKVHEIMRRMD